MQTNPSVEQNKNIKWSESPWNQSGNYKTLLIGRPTYAVGFLRCCWTCFTGPIKCIPDAQKSCPSLHWFYQGKGSAKFCGCLKF